MEGGAAGLQGRVVVVTGAASGIGRAMAQRMAQAGARLALLDLDVEGCEATAAGMPVDASTLVRAVDITDPTACKAAVEEVAAHFGAIDVLVNNAGISHRSPLLETDIEVYRRVMDVNFFGAVHCTQAALPSLLRSRGSIVVVSSIAGFSPLVGRTGYCASKHALHGFFETARCELRPRGVHVMLVCPGFTRTRIEQSALGAHGAPAARPQSRVGSVASPDEVAEAVYRGVLRRRRLIVLSPVGRLTRALTRLAPGLYERLMSRSLRSELEAGP
jgi:NAD(P)-dependent dehydrogenase (short-subunit alcohol dehydrogenase family)